MQLNARETVEREHVNGLWSSLGELRDFYAQISYTMTNYDQWTLKQKISGLENGIQKLNFKIPKAKFKFRRKKEEKAEVLEDKTRDVEKQAEFTQAIKGIENLKNQTIILNQEDLDSSFKIVGLQDCTIELRGCIHMLFLRNLTRCTVLSCPVSNSVMGHHLNDCRISLIGHQIRLHDSYDTHFYIYTTSRLIIEDCSRVSFHEVQHKYEELPQHIAKSGLKGANLWKEVQDFKWIKKERSPNFVLVFDGEEKAPVQEIEEPEVRAPIVQENKVSEVRKEDQKAPNITPPPAQPILATEEHPVLPNSLQKPKQEPIKPVHQIVEPIPQKKSSETAKPIVVEKEPVKKNEEPKKDDEDIDEI